MNNWLVWGYVWQRTLRLSVAGRLARSEQGEGVISTAIAVLVMAALGVLMWTLFQGTLTTTQTNVDSEIGKISG
ncbi:MAG: hypothetical protein QOG87_1112 [Actinomycetota bacterium]|jgi:hypothetical protein